MASVVFKPHEYQRDALQWLITRTILEGQGGAGLLLDPGLGKTSTTLSWLRLLFATGLSKRVLIVAPLRVVDLVWPQERAKWEQFSGFECSTIHGTATQRLAALAKPADIYLINPEGLPWLVQTFEGRPLPFDTLVVDESSKFKTWGGKRTKALRKIAPKFARRLILTGTPSPNNLQDLFSQVYLIDLGEALGNSITKFRTRYFDRGGFGGYGWIPKPGAKEAIEAKIAPLVLRLSEEDHLKLPAKVVNDIWVDLPRDVLKAYKRLEREMFLALEHDKELTPVNAGAKYVACRQFANGGVYDAEKNAHDLHFAKVEAIADLADELQGKPLLIAFQFKHDLTRLRKVFPKLPSIDGQTPSKESQRLVDAWNAGALRCLAVQPQSLSHGVNMQAGPGRDIAWLGLTDELEIYLQFNKRIHRQGVTGQVRIHRVLASRTVDVAMVDRNETKDGAQKSLLDALNDYRKAEA